MSRRRERVSARGLLPLMEARPRKDGKVTYRYHPRRGKPISLGTDRLEAIRAVLEMNNPSSLAGTVQQLWDLYRHSQQWTDLSANTQRDYQQCSNNILEYFGSLPAAAITPALCANYLRVQRADAPVRANREMALLSNLLNVAIERGEILQNPCREVRRNKERPRSDAPEEDQLQNFLQWANQQDGQATTIAAMAEFAALTGNRRIEFLNLDWSQIGKDEIHIARSKQRGKNVIEAIAISPALARLLERLRGTEVDPPTGPVFPTRTGNAYQDRGFLTLWARLMKRALESGVVQRRFTFHDLRAYYVTQFKSQRGALPDLHANPATTARVYDRSKVVRREAL